jgi:hypothetical protein
MTDPAFNLAMSQVYPNWYDHLPAVEAAMAEESRVANARLNAGWEGDEGGWYSPDGVHESAWEEEGRPFPEDDDYADFWDAYIHYEALDNDLNPDLNFSTS